MTYDELQAWWEEYVAELEPLGEAARFLVVGMDQGRPVTVDMHRVTPQSHHYIVKSTFQNRDRDIRYSNVYAGVRLWRHATTGPEGKVVSFYLPVPPPREEGRE